MKTVLAVTALAFALSLSGGVAAASEKEATAKEAKSKRVCKRIKVTGSRIKERVCRTQRDWDAIAQESQETLDKQREGVSVNTSAGDS